MISSRGIALVPFAPQQHEVSTTAHLVTRCLDDTGVYVDRAAAAYTAARRRSSHRRIHHPRFRRPFSSSPRLRFLYPPIAGRGRSARCPPRYPH